MTTSIDSLGDRVRERREKISLSQEGLGVLVARETGQTEYHQTAISAIERNSRKPSVDVLVALAKILETNVDYLLGLTDDVRPIGDMEEHVMTPVSDPKMRRALQEVLDLLASASESDQQYVIELIHRLIPKPPRIIGG